MKQLFVAATFVLYFLCALQAGAAESVAQKNSAAIYPVSLLTLIENPDKYDGKVVLVEGVFAFYFSESKLFASMEWYRHSIFINSVSLRLDVNAKEINKYASWTGKYVAVQGVFDAKDRGPLGGSSGAIKDVSYLHLMNEPIIDTGKSGH